MPLVLGESWRQSGFGLYLHWPYCESKCPYCDFNSHVVESIDHERWQRAYLIEIDRAGRETPNRVLNSVFFGGGTPSLMRPGVVKAILDKIKATWPISNDLEVTLEANPSSVEADRFAAFQEAGVNRVSLGVQALNDPDLKKLGRLHSADEALRALDIAKSTFGRVSFDLIYARQDQSQSDWEAELKAALSLAQGHLSLYQLTIEPNTAFGRRHERTGLHGLPSEDQSIDLYEVTQEICADAGYDGYEISNHALEGHESKHNLIYWRNGDYVGIGPGAHGRLTINGQRLATETYLGPVQWLRSVETRSNGETVRSVLSKSDALTELVLMGLRTKYGIDKNALLETVSDEFWRRSDQLVNDGYIKRDDLSYSLSPKGRPLLNSIAAELLRDQ